MRTKPTRSILISYMILLDLTVNQQGRTDYQAFFPPFIWFLAAVWRTYIMTTLPEGINKQAKATIPFVSLPRNIDPLSIYAKSCKTNVISTAAKYHFCQMTVADVRVCLDAAAILLQIFLLRFTLPFLVGIRLIRLGGQQESRGTSWWST